jgi:hypothetical protein
MSAVSLTYILMAKEGLRLSAEIAYPAGVAFAGSLFCVYLYKRTQYRSRETVLPIGGKTD